MKNHRSTKSGRPKPVAGRRMKPWASVWCNHKVPPAFAVRLLCDWPPCVAWFANTGQRDRVSVSWRWPIQLHRACFSNMDFSYWYERSYVSQRYFLLFMAAFYRSRRSSISSIMCVKWRWLNPVTSIIGLTRVYLRHRYFSKTAV